MTRRRSLLYLAYALLHRATHCPTTTRSPATTPCRAYPYAPMRPSGVDIRKLKAMAAGLGARDFRERPYFPDPYAVLNKSWSMAEGAALSDDELMAAHRALQIKHHPDRHASTLHETCPPATHAHIHKLSYARATYCLLSRGRVGLTH